MCGIVGIIAPEASRYRITIQKMTDSLRHRGPDAEGSHFFKNCALGHRRLSIVDLCAGQQPMLSSDKCQGITFNGEIYGFSAIRAILSDNFNFLTTSDTEVILALYRKHGNKLINNLPGMFAFAIWDDTNQTLFCARDRFGEKPFYYAFGSKGEFVFASEIKAIIASGLVNPRLDKRALAHYLKRLYVPVNQTIYENVYTLPPAHCLKWQNGTIKVDRYWELPAPSCAITMDAAVERFRSLLTASVEKQLVADVEIGAFLSGGLDSSTMVALAAEHTSRIKTIAFGFGEMINELPFAREIARRYGTEHVEICDSDFRLADLLIEMSNVYDEPFADSSNIPTFLICRHAATKLKVVLTGDGADELLAGYNYWYRPLYWAERQQSENTWKKSLACMAASCAARIGVKIPQFLSPLYNGPCLIKKGTMAEIHAAQNVFFSDRELETLGFSCADKEIPKLYGGVDDAFRIDLGDYMPGDILTKTDRASMANSLELRAPFLDVEVASFLISLPVSLKIDADEDKIILRRAFAERWTELIRKRSKQGFGAPVNAWLQRNDMKEQVNNFLRDPEKKIHGYFHTHYLDSIANEDNYRTWIMLVLSIWMENHDFV